MSATALQRDVPAGTSAPVQPAPERRFQLLGATPSRIGMRFDPRLPFEDWRELGPKLSTHATAARWWLGDWLAFGQYKYGRRYKLGVAVTGLDYQTLRNYALVARRFELQRRRPDLSFQHHAEVCALTDEEQDAWLDRATRNGWSRNLLRRHLRAAGAGRPGEPASFVRLSIELGRHERWLKAAACEEASLEAWIVNVLDAAAENALALTAADAEQIEASVRKLGLGLAHIPSGRVQKPGSRRARARATSPSAVTA